MVESPSQGVKNALVVSWVYMCPNSVFKALTACSGFIKLLRCVSHMLVTWCPPPMSKNDLRVDTPLVATERESDFSFCQDSPFPLRIKSPRFLSEASGSFCYFDNYFDSIFFFFNLFPICQIFFRPRTWIYKRHLHLPVTPKNILTVNKSDTL